MLAAGLLLAASSAQADDHITSRPGPFKDWMTYLYDTDIVTWTKAA